MGSCPCLGYGAAIAHLWVCWEGGPREGRERAQASSDAATAFRAAQAQATAMPAAGTEEVVDIFSDGSCKALYTFNHDASDRSGNYSLTEYNSSNNLWGAGGKFNTGYRIKEASNGYLGITNHGFNYTDTAVSFWFYADKALGAISSTYEIRYRTSQADLSA